MRLLKRSIVRILLVSFLTVGCCARNQPPANPALDHLLAKMNERLALMEKVAATKFRKGLPAADKSREETMLRAIEAKARDSDLPPTVVRWFFAAQIEAAKLVQENYFRHWKEAGEPPADNGDIFELRQRIDQLNDELIALLRDYRKQPATRGRIEERARELIRGDGIDDAVRTTAIRPLLERDVP